MMGTRTTGLRFAGLLGLGLLLAFWLLYSPAAQGAGDNGVIVSEPIEADSFDGDLADLPKARGPERAPSEGRVPGFRQQRGSGAEGDGSARTPGDRGDASVSAPIVNFEGARNTSVAPPDPTGEVGPNHFVEAINSRFQIFDRNGAPLTVAANINTLWAGTGGGNCETTNDGDPIVMYDQLNDRWIIAQFSVANNPSFSMCIAISKTADPVTGGWWLYTAPMAQFPDYEKFGIWRDGLYMTTFEGANNGAFVFDYPPMRSGGATTFQKKTTPSLDQFRGTRLLPADIDGETLNPVGTPNVMLQTVDGEQTAAAGDVDRIEIFEFDTDFATPANTTFTEVIELPTAPFDALMCPPTGPDPAGRNCIPEAGGPGLDPLSNRPMWRASYRVFDNHQAIVFNQTVDDDNSPHAAIRWYELRKPLTGGAWSIYQQGTFSPDSTNHRWMGSAAINRLDEIGLGYSISSPTIFPSLNYTGRVASDPLGQLGPEQSLVVGGEPQAFSNRWGDYSHMSIDPLDDCTMWFVGEYGDRRTRIGSFQVSDCVPDTSISGPSGTIADNTPTFTLTADEAGATIECKLDTGAYAPCPASYTTPTLSDGPHTLSARATDVMGGVDPTPATRSFTVDTTAPTVTIDSGPQGAIGNPSASFGFSSDDAAATFTCALDGAAPTSCTSPASYNGLADGSHSFSVSATDAVGNTSQPAARQFSVDTGVDGARLRGKRSQRQRGKRVIAKVKVTADEAVDLAVSGRVKARRVKGKFKTVRGSIAGGETATVKLRLPKGKSKKVKRALRRRKGKATVNVTFTDQAGNQTSASKKIKLKR